MSGASTDCSRPTPGEGTPGSGTLLLSGSPSQVSGPAPEASRETLKPQSSGPRLPGSEAPGTPGSRDDSLQKVQTLWSEPPFCVRERLNGLHPLAFLSQTFLTLSPRTANLGRKPTQWQCWKGSPLPRSGALAMGRAPGLVIQEREGTSSENVNSQGQQPHRPHRQQASSPAQVDQPDDVLEEGQKSVRPEQRVPVADGEQVPPAQGGSCGPAPCSLGGPGAQASAPSPSHPTPALNRDSSVQVTSMTSSQSRSATQGGFLCSSAGDADPSSWGAHGGPRGARVTCPAWQAALSTPHDSAPAGGTSPVAGVASGFVPGRGQVLPQPSGRHSPDWRLPGFQSLGARGAVGAPVCLRTQQRAGGSLQSPGVPSTTPLLEGSLRAIRVHRRLPGSPGSLGP